MFAPGIKVVEYILFIIYGIINRFRFEIQGLWVMSFVLIKNSAKTITTLTNLFFGSVPRPEKMKTRRIRNAKKLTYSEWKSFAFETVAFFSDIACLLLVIIYNEIPQLISSESQSWVMSDCMLVTAACSSIFHLMSHTCDLKVEMLSNQQRQIKISQIITAIIKIIFSFIHPSQYFIDVEFNGNGVFRSLNLIFTTICCFRIVFIYTYLTKNSRYYGTRISRLLSVYGHRNKATNIMYAIKCLFKEEGVLANSFLFLFATVFLALIANLVSEQNGFLTQIYLCLQTMATIGYGQSEMQNSLQRFVLILVIISGSFASSAFTIYFLQFLELEDKQSKAYRLIKRLEIQERITTQKISLIQKFLKRKCSTSLSRRIWLDSQKQLQFDKSPIIEYLTMKYTYFCNSLRSLLQSQLLSNNLLTFYFNRMEKHDTNKELKITRKRLRPLSKKRAQDSLRLNNIKRKILGYKPININSRQ